MNRTLWSRLHPLIVECSMALFEAYGASIQYGGEAERALVHDEGIAAFIGFSGETIRGTMVVSASFGVLEQLHPRTPGGARPTEDDQRDWTGELANQLLGRLKLRLAAYGVSFTLSTPTSLVGRDLRGVSSEPDGPHFLVFCAGRHEIYVQFDAQTTPDFILLDTPVAPAPPVIEGEMMLF